MPSVRRSALLPYSPAALFGIVNDVSSYPEFLPWCREAWIVEQAPGEMVAALSLSASGFTETFTTRNRLTPFERIDMTLESGPFRHLSGGWTFTDLGADSIVVRDRGCRVELALDFQPRGMARLLTGAFSRAADDLVDAFCSRANDVLSASPASG